MGWITQPKDKDWLNGCKNKTPIYVVYKKPTSKQGTHTARDQKKAEVAILISDKINFKIKAVKGDKEGHYIMIKGSIQVEDITIINIYVPGGSEVKVSASNAGDLGLIPGSGRSPGGGHGNWLQYSCLENPHRQRSLEGYSPCGHKKSDTTEGLSAHTSFRP